MRKRTPTGGAAVATVAASRPKMPSLGSFERRVILAVLVIEVLSNVINGVVSLIDPAASIKPLSKVDPGDVGVEIARWFGALNIVIGYTIARMLNNPAALPPLLEALCVGDIVYCIAVSPFASKYGQMPGIVAPFALTAVMFVARARLLWLEDWEGARASMGAGKARYSVLGE